MGYSNRNILLIVVGVDTLIVAVQEVRGDWKGRPGELWEGLRKTCRHR